MAAYLHHQYKLGNRPFDLVSAGYLTDFASWGNVSKITQAMGGTAPHKHFKNTLKYWYIQLITSKYIYISV